MSSGAATPTRRNTAVSGGRLSSAKRFKRKPPLHAAVNASRNPHSAAPMRRAAVAMLDSSSKHGGMFRMPGQWCDPNLAVEFGVPSVRRHHAHPHLGAATLSVDNGDAGEAVAVWLPRCGTSEHRLLE